MSGIENKNHIFCARYDYGTKEQQIINKNALISLIETLIVRIFKAMIYTGASFLRNSFIDPARIETARKQLSSIGAESVKLKTPDGDILDGMYLNANNFKSKLEKLFYVVETEEDGIIKQKLTIKPEFCTPEEQKTLSGEPYYYLKPNDEVQSFLNDIEGIGISINKNEFLSIEFNTFGPCIEISNISKNLPVITDEKNSHPTALFAAGSATCYPCLKNLAAAYLLRGINVMMIDFRGYGASEGSPTTHKTKLDLETAYQYLSKEKGVENKDLVVHAHCLGGGAATDLAARRKGVNLILDRSFSEYREVARNRFPVISNIVYKALPWIANYNNSDNLKKIEGNIAIAMAKNDVIISEEQTIKQINNLPNNKKGQFIKLIDSPSGHAGLWTNYAITALQFNQFLEQAKLRRNIF